MNNIADNLKSHIDENMKEFTVTYFYLFQPYTKLISILNKNHFNDVVFTCYIKSITAILFSNQTETENTKYKMAFILGGLWSLLTFWIMNSCVKTPEELGEII